MPIPELLLKQMKCCVTKDGHIVIEPFLLKCGGNACQQCVKESFQKMIFCYFCNEKHEKENILNSPKNLIAETMVKSFLTDLFQDVNQKLESTIEASKGLNFKKFDFFILIFNKF